MSFSTLLGLFFCNLLWSATYSLSKSLMNFGYHPLEVSFLRHSIALIPLLVFCLWGGRRSLAFQWFKSAGRVDLRILIVGVLTFFLSPFFQLSGLRLSRAIDSSVMTAIEPLFTVLAACVLLRERLRAHQIFAFICALVGVGILTELTWEKFSSFSDGRFLGNGIFIISLLCKAGFSVISKPALDRRSPVIFLTLSLLAGVLVLFMYNILMDGPARLSGLVPLWQSARLSDVAALVYMGIPCTSFAYLYWMIVLKDASISSMTLTLYVQPVMGTLLGYFWLGESITRATLLGTLLICLAVWLGSRSRSDHSVQLCEDSTASEATSSSSPR